MGLKIRNTIFEKGRPQVAVSLTGKTYDEIISQCKAAVNEPVQVIEWRVDYYLAAIENIEQKLIESELYLELLKIIDDIRDIIGDMPLIFTLRSKEQGGQITINGEQVEGLQLFVIDSGNVDLIDVEIRGLNKKNGGIGGRLLQDRVNKIHNAGAKVILSYHEFDEMIPSKDVVRLIAAMGNYNGDLYKVAAMAGSVEDAKEMIRATAFLSSKNIGPAVTIAMGAEGAITRVIGGKYGSVMTFASVGEPSAPGQISAAAMKEKLDKFYGA